jgi:sortase A
LGIGAALFAVGVLAVAFVAYQLWGTALYEEQAQSHLTAELAHELHRTLPTSAAEFSAGGVQHRLPALAAHTAPASTDPAVNQPVGLLSIPKIGILDTIVEGVGEAQLEQGPGHYPGTPLPGEPGNVAIAGHRTTYAHPFYNLNALDPGDNVYILTKQGFFRYTVTGSEVVDPSDVAILESIPDHSTLTLTTCNPRYSASTRLVITADFDGRTAGDVPAQQQAPDGHRLESDAGGALDGGGGPVLPAILWGIVTVLLLLSAVLLFRRARQWMRLAVLLLAIPAVGLSLLVCFEHISLALPGSY